MSSTLNYLGSARCDDFTNLSRSDASLALPQWLQLAWSEPQAIRTVELTFPGHLLREYHAYSPYYRDPQCPKNYEIQAELDNKWVVLLTIEDNYQRYRRHIFETAFTTKHLRIVIFATNGDHPLPSMRFGHMEMRTNMFVSRSCQLNLSCVSYFTIVLLCSGSAYCQDNQGNYTIRPDQPQQTILGLGFEIQSDSIGSGNAAMPDDVIAVPHDLIPSERIRFYKQMLHGFRYSRLAMGLYLRGTDADQKHIEERYHGQMDDLRQMQNVAGIEGFDVEYWSPAPFWKKNKSYYGDTIASNDPDFVDQFTDAMVDDLKYLQANGLHVAMWGLQNEPVVGRPKKKEDFRNQLDAAQSYATCYYTPQDYATVLGAAAPKIRELLPNVHIHAPSWDGAAGEFGTEIQKRPELLKNVDAWTWHQIGRNSNDQIDLRSKYMLNAGGIPFLKTNSNINRGAP